MLTLILTIANKDFILIDSVTRYIIPCPTRWHFYTQLLSSKVIGFSCCPVSIRCLSRTIEAAVRNGPSPAVQHIIIKSNPSRAGLAAKLSQRVHIVCVVKGGQVCVIGPAVTLCFTPALRFVHKVVLVRESWAKGEEVCSQKAENQFWSLDFVPKRNDQLSWCKYSTFKILNSKFFTFKMNLNFFNHADYSHYIWKCSVIRHSSAETYQIRERRGAWFSYFLVLLSQIDLRNRETACKWTLCCMREGFYNLPYVH